jgi:hypothetical protein
MKGIYLTEEGKKEIEIRIAKINSKLEDLTEEVWENLDKIQAELHVLEEVLSSATILPVEDNWDEIRLLDIIDSSGTGNLTKAKYPNGVIIKPKE